VKKGLGSYVKTLCLKLARVRNLRMKKMGEELLEKQNPDIVLRLKQVEKMIVGWVELQSDVCTHKESDYSGHRLLDACHIFIFGRRGHLVYARMKIVSDTHPSLLFFKSKELGKVRIDTVELHVRGTDSSRDKEIFACTFPDNNYASRIYNGIVIAIRDINNRGGGTSASCESVFPDIPCVE